MYGVFCPRLLDCLSPFLTLICVLATFLNLRHLFQLPECGCVGVGKGVPVSVSSGIHWRLYPEKRGSHTKAAGSAGEAEVAGNTG